MYLTILFFLILIIRLSVKECVWKIASLSLLIESEMNFVSFGEKIPRRIIVSSRDFLLHITQNLISHLVRVILDACLDIYVTYEKHEAIKRIYIYIYTLFSKNLSYRTVSNIYIHFHQTNSNTCLYIIL